MKRINSLHQLRSAYLDFFQSKPRSHELIPSAPLIPENDPTTLFTSCGMQPLVPYLLGQPHPQGTRLVNAQKTFRSQDIEEVGDNRHTTFFEMLGNWSLGDYFKQEQLSWFFEFLVQVMKLDPSRLYVTVFSGNADVSRDTESAEIWKKLFADVGVGTKTVADAQKNGLQDGRIFLYDEKKNWWSRFGVPSAMPAGEPGGPDSEVFYDFGKALHLHENSGYKNDLCHVNCDCGRFLEIANSVFMQYQKQKNNSFLPLPKNNVDFGGGLERMLAALEEKQDIFCTDAFYSIVQTIENISNKKYENKNKKNFRIIADHLKAAVMLISDGVVPSNKQQGYLLRRLIRRAVRYASLLEIREPFTAKIAKSVISLYQDMYTNVKEQHQTIQDVLAQEEEKFSGTLTKGMRIIGKYDTLNGESAFYLYETFGFPFELTEEIARERGQKVDYGVFRKAFEEHQKKSRLAGKGLFTGGLADNSAIVTQYHTVTHLLHAALRKILGTHVSQQGSNITAQRLRFDFSHSKPLTTDEKQNIEDLINEKIAQNLPVHQEMMKKESALKQGAFAFFIERYADVVSVYTIGKDSKRDWFSKELCGGPHVNSTGEIGKIEIVKEESIGSGKRRIYLRLA